MCIFCLWFKWWFFFLGKFVLSWTRKTMGLPSYDDIGGSRVLLYMMMASHVVYTTQQCVSHDCIGQNSNTAGRRLFLHRVVDVSIICIQRLVVSRYWLMIQWTINVNFLIILLLEIFWRSKHYFAELEEESLEIIL